MPVEVKLLPQFQHLSSDGQSMIILDVKRARIIEVDRVTATVIEEGHKYGSFCKASFDSARSLLAMYGISSEAVELSITKVEELIRNGFFPEDNTEGFPGRKPRHSAIVLDVAQTCQLGCVYCFAGGGSFGDSRLAPLMSSETGRKAVDFFISIADPDVEEYFVTFFGGEPTLNWGLIKELTLYASDKIAKAGKKVQFMITTNGVNVDEEKVDFMKEHNFSVLVSIDGNHELHNQLRPHKDSSVDSYESTASAIKLLRDAFGHVSGRATVTPLCCDPAIVYDYLVETGITDPAVIMVGTNSGDSMEFSPEDLRTFTKGLQEIFYSGKNYSQGRKFLSNLKRPSHVPRVCSYAQNTICVDSSGRIFGCHRMVANENYYIGDIFNGLDEAKVSNFVENITALNMLGCRTCWARYICRGTCPAESFEATGSHFYPDSRWCYINQALAVSAIEIYLRALKDTPQVVLSNEQED